jgi:hypothetical protein
MPEPTLLPERIFGLSAVDGRRTVRPGEIITFTFRAKNGSEVATPTALLVCVLPPGWSPLDPLQAEIPPVAPGSEHAVSFRARPDVADETTAESPVQAALHLDTVVLGSNVVHMRVFGHPRMNGPASSVRITAAGGDAWRVSVTVVNEGDAAATGVRVVAPLPPGYIGAEADTIATRAELAVGATLAYEYIMEPDGPAAATVRIDDAYVCYDGGRVALTTSADALLAPEIAAPEITAERRATRLDVRVRIANSGWVPARDVHVNLELPVGWRVLRGTMRVDGAPPTIRRGSEGENGVGLALPLLPARGSVDLTVVASTARPGIEGDITVRCGEHVATLPIPDVAGRALLIDARPESAFAEPGSAVSVAIDVHNTGEKLERVSVYLNGEACWEGELRAGAAAATVARYTMPAGAVDGDTATVIATATGTGGDELAAVHFELRALDRPWIAIDEVVLERDRTRVTIRNVGATTARDVRIAGETDALIERLGAGETFEAVIDPMVARRAAIVAQDGRVVPIGWDDQAAPVEVRATLLVPADIRTGERLDVRLRLTGTMSVHVMRVRPHKLWHAPYIAGSTWVNGHAVVDSVKGPPLFSADGLALHDIPAGTNVDIGWSLLPQTPGDLLVTVDVDANSVAVELEPVTVVVADTPPFGARPNALPFHIDAPTVGDPGGTMPYSEPALLTTELMTPTSISLLPPAPAPSDPNAWALAPPDPDSAAFDALSGPAITISITLDDDRAAAIVRVLRGSRGPGLIGHIPSLAVLYPTSIVSGDGQLDATFRELGEAIRGVYERLFVKLRIPGYAVMPGDLEDEATRRDLLSLFERITAIADAAPGAIISGDIHARFDRSRIAAARAALVDTPLGGPLTLAAVVALLPRYGSGEAGTAVGAYAAELAAAFEAAAGQAPQGFIAYLNAQVVPALDAARATAVAALERRIGLSSR